MVSSGAHILQFRSDYLKDGCKGWCRWLRYIRSDNPNDPITRCSTPVLLSNPKDLDKLLSLLSTRPATTQTLWLRRTLIPQCSYSYAFFLQTDHYRTRACHHGPCCLVSSQKVVRDNYSRFTFTHVSMITRHVLVTLIFNIHRN